MEPHQYIRRFPLIMTFTISALATMAAITYVVSSAFIATDPQSLVDQAVQRHDMTVCASAPDDAARKSCFDTAFPAVGTAAQCSKIPFTDVQTRCTGYFEKLTALKAKSETLKKKLTYDQVQLDATFTDGSTKRFKVLVADTDDKRTQGLSYIDLMNANEGMLFTFPADMPEIAFHMKDMLLPLDIIFMNGKFEAVQNFRNLPSCAGEDACPLQRRKGGDVQYVLEVLPQGKEMTKLVVEK